jgi:hypothetical protein
MPSPLTNAAPKRIRVGVNHCGTGGRSVGRLVARRMGCTGRLVIKMLLDPFHRHDYALGSVFVVHMRPHSVRIPLTGGTGARYQGVASTAPDSLAPSTTGRTANEKPVFGHPPSSDFVMDIEKHKGDFFETLIVCTWSCLCLHRDPGDINLISLLL